MMVNSDSCFLHSLWVCVMDKLTSLWWELIDPRPRAARNRTTLSADGCGHARGRGGGDAVDLEEVRSR
jgi:hypothetical protein